MVKILLSVRSSLGSQSASNVGPHSVRHRNAIPTAFRWRADSGPLLHAHWAAVRSKVVTNLQSLRMAPVTKFEALPVGLGNRENGIYVRENRGTMRKFEGNREKKTILWKRVHIKITHFRVFGNRGTSQLISGNKQTGAPWVGLMLATCIAAHAKWFSMK